MLPDPEAAVAALAAVDPIGPPPEPEPKAFATVADIRRQQSEVRWLWEGWLPAARIIGLGAFEGTGKTRMAMDLCRRGHRRLEWPDGQAPTLAEGARFVWLCADDHQDELAEIAGAYGLPDEAIVFPAPPEEPYTGTDLDDPATLATLEDAIAAVKPALVFIDTLTNATGRDLCSQDQMKPLKAPLARLARTYLTTIILLLHLNREGQALGRRIKGVTRTLIHMEESDPEGDPGHLKLWVEKSYAKKPPALGLRMGDTGNAYDFDPPRRPEPNKGGRPPESREKAEAFIRAALAEENDQKAAALCARWEAEHGNTSAFWRARNALVEAGELICDGKPLILHLIRQGPAEAP